MDIEFEQTKRSYGLWPRVTEFRLVALFRCTQQENSADLALSEDKRKKFDDQVLLDYFHLGHDFSLRGKDIFGLNSEGQSMAFVHEGNRDLAEELISTRANDLLSEHFT